tara:strand:- start:279 stop:830 length:552 start_codon:yes stop_codon:yes gene_type:complete
MNKNKELINGEDPLIVTRKNADIINEITGLNINLDSKQLFKNHRKYDTILRNDFLEWLVKTNSELTISKNADEIARVVNWEIPAGLVYDAKTFKQNDDETILKSKSVIAKTIYLNSYEEIEEVFKDFVMVGLYSLRESDTDELLYGNYMIRFAGKLSEVWDVDLDDEDIINIEKKYWNKLIKK